MCATFEAAGRLFRPGRPATAISSKGWIIAPWAGFARSEILSWWRSQNALLLDLPATRFAERSSDTGLLIWEDVPPGLVLRAILDSRKGQPLLKIVTRAATPREAARFGHPRLPLLEKPLFPAPQSHPPLPDTSPPELPLFAPGQTSLLLAPGFTNPSLGNGDSPFTKAPAEADPNHAALPKPSPESPQNRAQVEDWGL